MEAAKQFYAKNLKAALEPSHNGKFVAIELESGNYFLGKTLSEAIQAAREAYPSRLAPTLRVGAEPAIHIGGWV